MKSNTKEIILSIIETDKTFNESVYRNQDVWIGKCIQCNRKLVIAKNGQPISEASIEHIIPKNHDGTDEIKNLAISCKNCNNLKGRTVDNKRRGHPKLQKVIASLQEKRRKRWRHSEDL